MLNQLHQQDLLKVLNDAPAGLCVLNADTLVVEVVNTVFLTIANKTEQDMLGLKYWDIFSDWADEYAGFLTSVVKDGQPFHTRDVEMEMMRNGVPVQIFVSFSYLPVKDADGKVIKIAIWLFENTLQIKSQQMAEAARLKTENAERTLRNLIMQAPVAIIVFRGHDMCIESVNPFMLQLLGKGSDIEGKPLLNAFPELAGQHAEQLLHKVYNTGEPEYGNEIPVKLKRNNKPEIGYFNFSYTPLVEDGKIVGVIDMAVEVTEQVIAHKQLQQRKDDFIGIASHELKTPITSLKAALQLMDRMKDNPSSPMFTRMISQSLKSMDKISELIEALLNVSQMNEGKVKLNKTVFPVSKILNDCCSHIRADGAYEFVFEGDKDIEVEADEHRIDQVIVNFVNNAVKYAPDSKTIYLKAEDLGDKVKISVRDEGPGISVAQQAHLFERYYRSEQTADYHSGLGLGLYISAEIIRRHDGEIGVSSMLGKGSTFWFTLPKAK